MQYLTLYYWENNFGFNKDKANTINLNISCYWGTNNVKSKKKIKQTLVQNLFYCGRDLYAQFK